MPVDHPRGLQSAARVYSSDDEVEAAQRFVQASAAAIRFSRALSVGRNVTSDVRNFHAHKILSMGVRSTMQHLYPRLLALHDLSDDTALPDPGTGQTRLPSLMRDSYLFMESHGMYLIGTAAIWFGVCARMV